MDLRTAEANEDRLMRSLGARYWEKRNFTDTIEAWDESEGTDHHQSSHEDQCWSSCEAGNAGCIQAREVRI